MAKIKVPTLDDYHNYNGRSCHQIWNELDDEWKCPGCGRTKFEIMRWTRISDLTYTGPDKRYLMGWSANLHRHHDHLSGDIIDMGNGRFHETIICCDCNSADAAAKRKLGLPKDFSFSPSEIYQFVTATPHGKHARDDKIALKIFNNLTDISGI